ncbi:MAG: response regulator [Desulfobulbaceae bacterium]|nr:response regulator [Desulfobulbaceae bacterium]
MHLSLKKNSLSRQALVGMALRITVIITVATGVSYWHMHSTLRTNILRNLSNYAELRGRAANEQFQLAELQSKMVRDEFLARLKRMGDHDPQAEFDRLFVREADGLIRVRPEINDYRHHATAYLRHDVPLTPDLRRRFLIGWQLLDQWGPLLVNRFFSGFMNMPEQLSINFCPTADWGRSASRDTDISIYETVWRAGIAKNPKRLPFWTKVYFDPGAKAWMVSCVTPGDEQGRWVVTGGQDVEIADLIKLATAAPVEPGAWNFLVDEEGNLIAHPDLTQQIAKAGGNLQVNGLGDPRLVAMVKAALATGGHAPQALELADLDVFMGVSRLKGPGWYFVAVYPHRLLAAQAMATARIFLAIGFATLLLELIIMATILRRRIEEPVVQLVAATERISHGDFSVRLECQRQDELALLAESVNRLAETVGERDAALTRQLAELKEARQIQVEQQKRECIGTLAGGIAHDFNNILGAIIGFTDLALLKDKNDETWRSYLQEVRKAADRATMLVRQILTFSRKQQQEKAPVQISLIVKEALKLLRASIPATIEIRQNIDSPAMIMADPTQIHQVVMNLCTNAYQAMLARGGVLAVTMQEMAIESAAMSNGLMLPPGRYLVLSVSDTGPGMNPETMARIFDPYFTTKPHGKGTGLGLAVVKGIVEGHNGRIKVESEPERGATFQVYLPVHVFAELPEVTDEAAHLTLATGQGRVMVVDDESSLRELLTRVLTEVGYQVEAFSNGLEAWQTLSQSPSDWDLLITDQTMPEMTGEQLAFNALTLRPDLPVIICSGYSATLNVEQVKKAGVFAYLDKPLEIHALLAQVAKAIEHTDQSLTKN